MLKPLISCLVSQFLLLQIYCQTQGHRSVLRITGPHISWIIDFYPAGHLRLHSNQISFSDSTLLSFRLKFLLRVVAHNYFFFVHWRLPKTNYPTKIYNPTRDITYIYCNHSYENRESTFVLQCSLTSVSCSNIQVCS